MINSKGEEYYHNYYGAYLENYLKNKNAQDTRFNYIIAFIIICILLGAIALSTPLLAQNQIEESALSQAPPENIIIYNQEYFQNHIKQKYKNSQITFPVHGIAHIKKTKYINKRPIKINIVEVNTKVNPNLKIKPQIAGEKLNSKATIRKIAQKESALIAINGGFFKPQTGVPLGALMIDGKVLTGPIYNRVGIAIFEENNKTYFKMQNIDFDIKVKTNNLTYKIDNINQPRMLQSYLLLYTSDWGKTCPYPPKTGYNMLIRNNKPVLISANPITLQSGDLVLQGQKDIISKIAKDGIIQIDIKLKDEIKNAKHIISAGPYLVKNSNVYVDTQVQKLNAISGKNPRSAIGFSNDGTLIMAVVDGREEASVGMTLIELGNLMKNLGCDWAMNFDGGSSSVIYIKGSIANSAVNKEGIAVSNALIISETQDRLAGI